MKLLASVLRIYAFVFHLTVGTFLFVLPLIAAWRHRPLAIGFMPFENEHLLSGTALLGAAGVGCSLLALSKTFRFVFAIWAGGFVYLLLKSFAEGAFSFEDPDVIRRLRWLTLAAVAAFAGALWSLKRRRASSLLPL